MQRQHGLGSVVAWLAVATALGAGGCATHVSVAPPPTAPEGFGSGETTRSVTIRKNGYRGDLWIDGQKYGGSEKDITGLQWADGPHTIDNGSHLGGADGSSNFVVMVTPDRVTVSPSQCANVTDKGGATEVELHVGKLDFERSGYRLEKSAGLLELAGHSGLDEKDLRVIVGLLYSVETGGRLGGTTFQFLTRPLGDAGSPIWSSSISASSTGSEKPRKLRINVTQLRILPSDASAEYRIASYPDEPLKGERVVPVVAGVKVVLMQGELSASFQPLLSRDAKSAVTLGKVRFDITHDVK